MMNRLVGLVDKLRRERILQPGEFIELLNNPDEQSRKYLFAQAVEVRRQIYGDEVYIRGLIEFTNYCRNNCYYCGIRRDNSSLQRYRLTPEEITTCCDQGYALGIRSFVLQGGEDAANNDAYMVEIIRAIKSRFPDCAVTLSIGERSRDSYQTLFAAGADRYLLRHETANEAHYASLHPSTMSWAHRRRCIEQLKEIGYQVGCGFMVGSPGQTWEHLAEDLLYIRNLEPHMVGIGPFIPQHDTPFAHHPAGSVELTLILLAVIRLLLPDVLLPATTALGTLCANGRERGLLAGANVVMPNISPAYARENYLLYDNKLNSGSEAVEGYYELLRSIEGVGYHAVSARGDCKRL